MQIILHFLWDHWDNSGIFKNGVLSQLKPRLPFSDRSVFFVSKGNLLMFTKIGWCIEAVVAGRLMTSELISFIFYEFYRCENASESLINDIIQKKKKKKKKL